MASLDRISEYVPDAADYALPMTWAEYLELEDAAGMRFEFEEGKLIMSPSGRLAHDVLRDLVLVWLSRYEEDHPDRCFVVSEHSFFMPPGKRDFRPDVAVVVDERKDAPNAGGWMEQAPDIAIEVLSGGTRDRDLGLKARRYFEHGADEYWVFDAEERSARFLRRGARGWVEAPLANERYQTPLLPGFELDLARLWRRFDEKLRRG
jgi:Uma2 family endonuclease